MPRRLDNDRYRSRFRDIIRDRGSLDYRIDGWSPDDRDETHKSTGAGKIRARAAQDFRLSVTLTKGHSRLKFTLICTDVPNGIRAKLDRIVIAYRTPEVFWKQFDTLASELEGVSQVVSMKTLNGETTLVCKFDYLKWVVWTRKNPLLA
jgi:hypothetical protein